MEPRRGTAMRKSTVGGSLDKTMLWPMVGGADDNGVGMGDMWLGIMHTHRVIINHDKSKKPSGMLEGRMAAERST